LGTSDETISTVNFSIKQLIKDADASKNKPDKDGFPILKPMMKYINMYGFHE
jgi:hypothetical protein